jgi:hypothetical protein
MRLSRVSAVREFYENSRSSFIAMSLLTPTDPAHFSQSQSFMPRKREHKLAGKR